MVKSEKTLRRRLEVIESELEEQMGEIMESEKGFGGPESLFFEWRVLERKFLRWALGMKAKPYNAADVFAGW